MFSHIMIGTNDVAKAKAFYDPLLATLGVAAGFVDRHRVFYRTPTSVFCVSGPINGEPASVGNGSTFSSPARRRAGRCVARAQLGIAHGEARPAKTRRASAKAPPAPTLCLAYLLPTPATTSCVVCFGCECPRPIPPPRAKRWGGGQILADVAELCMI